MIRIILKIIVLIFCNSFVTIINNEKLKRQMFRANIEIIPFKQIYNVSTKYAIKSFVLVQCVSHTLTNILDILNCS